MALTIGELTAYLTVEDELSDGVERAESSLTELGDTARQESDRAESSLEGVGKAAGTMDTTTRRASDRTGESFSRVGKSATDMGDSTAESSDRLTRFGETADAADERAMGFRDALTGVQDTMLGVGDLSRGHTMEGLMLLGTGFADLGSSIYKGVVPAITSVRNGFKDLRTSGSRTRTVLGRIGRGAGAAGLALGGLVAATHAVGAALGDEVNPDIEALVVGLERLESAGEITGQMTRLLGEDFNLLDDAIKASTDTLGNNFEEWLAKTTGVEDVGESIAKLRGRLEDTDEALARMAQESPERAERALQQLADTAGLSDEQFRKLKDDSLPQYTAAQETAAAKAKEHKEQLEQQVEALKAATDPVFALTSALDNVETAQTDYNEAVQKHGAESQQAQTASLELAEAVAGAEAAAKNGDLSFDEFRSKLDQWVAQGAVTAGQARNIAAEVRGARGEAESYGGHYNASVGLQGHWTVRQHLGGLMDFLDAFTMPHTAFVNVQTSGGIPGRASGGDVTSGRTYLVGEEGPELFTPDRSGYITPNDKLDRADGSPSGRGGRSGKVLHIENFTASENAPPSKVAKELDWLAKNRG
ncbi:hypothetical protein SAMN06265360_10618 [Haloechinothrix alba]|uniref:Uncharacterized protein n=1 Tax=Haloechinothrix alba TaxID=664784 RepID=A0A238WCB6_9PSEU|nr:hypothetical protein [Haloechinothrix alba]SNR44057.1 hypothetical protein SAMN06265360_10618 [Haloechinothrix alba]